MPTTTYAAAELDEGKDILTLLVETKLATNRSEARRLVQQGGVSVNDVKVTDVCQKYLPGQIWTPTERWCFAKVRRYTTR